MSDFGCKKVGEVSFRKCSNFVKNQHLSEMNRLCENQIWIKVSSFYFVAFNLLSFHIFQKKIGFIDITTWQLTRINFMLCRTDLRIFEAICK